MDTLDRSTLEELAAHQGWPAVSLYLPTHRAGGEAQQNPIRLKNLIRQAEEDLSAAGVRAAEVASLLEPARELLADGALWREGFEGLAIFIAPQFFRVYRTSTPLPEQARLSTRFQVRPLITVLDPALRFLVLALSKKRVRVLEGTVDEVHELEPEGIPQGLAEALKYDDYEKQLQFHSRTAASGGARRAAVFHGHGGSADTAKEDLLRYFRMVDRGLQDLLGQCSAPLLLAGVDYLLPMYREASTYPHLLPEVITGNPDEVSAHVIHAEAIGLLQPLLDGGLQRAVTRFAEGANRERISTDLWRIVPSAAEGRVETLFVSETDILWGSYDPESGTMTVRAEPGADSLDLLDESAAETLLHGGTVHVLSAERIRELTGGVEAAAIMRY